MWGSVELIPVTGEPSSLSAGFFSGRKNCIAFDSGHSPRPPAPHTLCLDLVARRHRDSLGLGAWGIACTLQEVWKLIWRVGSPGCEPATATIFRLSASNSASVSRVQAGYTRRCYHIIMPLSCRNGASKRLSGSCKLPQLGRGEARIHVRLPDSTAHTVFLAPPPPLYILHLQGLQNQKGQTDIQ